MGPAVERMPEMQESVQRIPKTHLQGNGRQKGRFFAAGMKPEDETEECPECTYLQKERAGMWIDNGADMETADKAGAKEHCPLHPPQPKQCELF